MGTRALYHLSEYYDIYFLKWFFSAVQEIDKVFSWFRGCVRSTNDFAEKIDKTLNYLHRNTTQFPQHQEIPNRYASFYALLQT